MGRLCSVLLVWFLGCAALLEIDHSYVVRAQCTVGGYPTIAAGDLRNRSLPFASAYFDSGVFTVIQ